MTLDEARSAFGFRPEITDEAIILSLEAIEYGWSLAPNVPAHDVIFARLDRQRNDFMPPPDEAEIAALLAAIQQEADRPSETLPSEGDDSDSLDAGSESDTAPILPDVVVDVAADSVPLGPMFGPAFSSPVPLPVERESSIPSRVLGFALIAIVVVAGVAFLYSHYSSVPTVKKPLVMAQSTTQEEQPQESSQVEPAAAPPMPKQFSWERSRERMLRRISDRRGK